MATSATTSATDPRRPRLRNQLVWRTVQTGSKGLGQYGTAFLLGYFYPPEEFGSFGIFLSLLVLLRLVGDFGLSRNLVRFVSQSPSLEQTRNLITLAAGVQLAALILALVLYAFTARLLGSLVESNALATLLPIYLVVLLASMFAESVLWGREEYVLLGRVGLVLHVLSLAAKYLLARSHQPIAMILWLDVAAMSLAAVAMLWMMRGRGLAPRWVRSTWIEESNRALLWEYVRNSLTLGTAGILFFLYTKVDMIILKAFRALGEVGQLNFAVQAYEVPLYAGTIITSVFLPRIARNANVGRERFLRREFRLGLQLMVLLMVVSAALLFFVVPLLVDRFFASYVPAMAILRVLVPLVVVKGVGQYCSGGYLVGTGRTRVMLYANLVGAVGNVVGDLLVVQRWGATGVAWVTLVVHGAVLLFTIIYSFKHAFSARPGIIGAAVPE